MFVRHPHRRRSEPALGVVSRAAGQAAAGMLLPGHNASVLFPGPLVPMQPALGKPFHRPGWIYEEKYDGWRMLAFRMARACALSAAKPSTTPSASANWQTRSPPSRRPLSSSTARSASSTRTSSASSICSTAGALTTTRVRRELARAVVFDEIGDVVVVGQGASGFVVVKLRGSNGEGF